MFNTITHKGLIRRETKGVFLQNYRLGLRIFRGVKKTLEKNKKI